ncbi:MAG: hypothetical protein ABW173_11210 [Sphingomonas sp.]
MTEDRLIAAFGRLEQAVARFETRLPRRLEERAPPPPAAQDDGAADARYARLEERHETLRAQTAAAVARLDRLLEPARTGGAAPAPVPPEPAQEE